MYYLKQKKIQERKLLNRNGNTEWAGTIQGKNLNKLLGQNAHQQEN